MATLLLTLIYLSFISLGLPDSLLGAAWPVMGPQLQAPAWHAGGISFLITASTVLSSLIGPRLTARLGTGRLNLVSVSVSALALWGFALAPSTLWMMVLAVPFGLAAGAVDAALNHYVAEHFAARHMSWLHCFWGVGACVSPYVMGFCLKQAGSWRTGYGLVALAQGALGLVLALTLFAWKPGEGGAARESQPALSLAKAVRIPGVLWSTSAFFAYCAMETTLGLWISSFLVAHRGVAPPTAATLAAGYFLGITLGRLIAGFVADRLGDKTLVRLGVWAMLAGALLLWVPFSWAALAGMLIIGVGGAPLYPSLIHATPGFFGPGASQAVIGLEMAAAYTGSSLMPALFGALPLWLLPATVLILCLWQVLATEALWHRVQAG